MDTTKITTTDDQESDQDLHCSLYDSFCYFYQEANSEDQDHWCAE